MKRIAISDAQLDPSLLWEYYRDQTQAIALLESTLLNQPSSVPCSLTAPFLGMKSQDVSPYFANLSAEIDHQVCLTLIASAEAAIMVDFFTRVYYRTKTPVTPKFRELYKRAEKENRRVRLDEEILEVWLDQKGSARKLIGEFRAALNYRHWLAHGRYWIPKLGRRYHPVMIQKIVDDLLRALDLR